jgi:DNA-binding response OmpR family regulator
MGSPLQDRTDRVMVVIADPSDAGMVAEMVEKQGIIPLVVTDPEKALEECTSAPPDIVIVDDDLRYMTGKQFLARLLRISWTTGSILITDDEEHIVHEKTEGLGILGRIRSYTDEEELAGLLRRYRSTEDRATRK